MKAKVTPHAMRRWIERFPGQDIHRAFRKAKRVGPERRKRIYAGGDDWREAYANRKVGVLFIVADQTIVTVLPYQDNLVSRIEGFRHA